MEQFDILDNFGVRPSIDFLTLHSPAHPPSSYQFFSKLVYNRVRLGPLACLGRALWLGQARGPGACGYMTHFIHVLNMRCIHKICRRWGAHGSKNRSLGNFHLIIYLSIYLSRWWISRIYLVTPLFSFSSWPNFIQR